MTTNILSPNWEGDTASPIDPDTIRIKAVQAPVFGECDGCLFIGQRSAVCNRANAIAMAAGDPDCDQVLPDRRSVIYVLDKSDPRQMPLIEKGH
ncbi:hypothetical protein QPK31_23370 [Massilia sp. YIM B02769]|uniref:hypothetical protein n=1 Tax=Massilia sp. YIM B02769 TaxID=3050129 RepID=UPI0025B73634|nr:hypothetical protein [Massilia sp. YIM B02769]MDN4061164.1 hypothetical protein [Massilia sp. YIM B02769]